MKKTFLVLAVSVLCLINTAFSQKTRAGVSAGPVVATMSGEFQGHENGHEKKLGYTFGMIVDVPLSAKFAFTPGLGYVQKGTLQRPPVGTLIDKSYVALRYAEFNANFIYKAPGQRGNFFIGAGPSFSFKLPSKKGTEIDKEKTETDVSFGNTVDKDFRGTDWGVNFLTGYRLNAGFFVSLNYNMGLKDLRPVITSGPEEVMNSYIGLQFGILLNNSDNK